MDEIKSFFLDKKNLTTLTTLLVMLVILPLGIALIRTQQLYYSKAAGERIKIGTGKCVVERDGKKVLICGEIPLVFNAPFDPSATPTPTETPVPTPTPEATTSAYIVDPEKMMSRVTNALIPEAKAVTAYNQCSGDTSPGQGGLWDIQTNGCGDIINYDSLVHSCSPEADIQFRAPFWNSSKNEWETRKGDPNNPDKIISQAEMLQKAAGDSRMNGATFLSSTSDPPYINCNLFITYSGRTDCETSAIRGLTDSTKLAPGDVLSIHVKRGTDPSQHNTFPDCREQVKTKVYLTSLSPSPTSTPQPTPTPTSSSQPTPTPSPTTNPGGSCQGGAFVSAQLEDSNNCGTILSQPLISATSGIISYKAPNVTSDTFCKLKVSTGNTGDCKLDPNGKGTADNPLKPNETMAINFSNACVDSAPNCELPIIISSSNKTSTDRASYKLAETEAGLASASESGFNTQEFNATYTLKDATPGMKTVWVEFTDKLTGQKYKDSLTPIELVENNPVIKQASCSLDITKSAININVSGLRFGTDKAKMSVSGTDVDVLSWDPTSIKGILRAPDLSAGDKNYKVKITRKDTVSSDEVDCRLGITQISLGTQLVCRGEGNLDLSNVALTIVDESGHKVEETGNISKDGILSGLKTKFEIGKNYSISLKAPKILRRTITFKATEGTTVITKDDGTTLQLPVGDIYPASSGGDGTINALDQAELIRQWRTVDTTASAALSADFNNDKRVNTFDWSCMRQNFGASNEPIPQAPTSGNLDTSFSDPNHTVTLDFGLPTPNPTTTVQSTTSIDASPSATESNSTQPMIYIQGK